MMYGSSTEYVVQIRVQDYWIDLLDGIFKHKDDAEKHYERAGMYTPARDFQIVKRTHTFSDEVLHHEPYSI